MSDLLAGRGGLHYKSEGGKEGELQGRMQPATGVSFLQKAIFKYQSFIHVLQGCGMGKKVPPRIWMFMRDVDKFLLHVWGVYYFYYTIWGCIYILLGCFYYTADGVLIWTLNWILKRKAGVHIYRIRLQSSWLWVDKILICYCFCVEKKSWFLWDGLGTHDRIFGLLFASTSLTVTLINCPINILAIKRKEIEYLIKKN